MLAKLTQQVARCVKRLLVMENPALSGAHRVQHGVGRRQAADSQLIADTGRLSEPAARVAGSRVAKHFRIKLAHLILKPGLDGRAIAELRTNVAEVDSADVRHALAA